MYTVVIFMSFVYKCTYLQICDNFFAAKNMHVKNSDSLKEIWGIYIAEIYQAYCVTGN